MGKFAHIAIVLIAFCSLSLYAQIKPGEPPEAYKFAEIGSINEAGMSAKMKAFCNDLNTGQILRGYIINYGTPTDIRARRKLILKGYHSCGYDGPRITFVDGPSAKRIRTLMWIVPEGAQNPSP